MSRDPRVKCARCRRYMRKQPTAKTTLRRARPPHTRLCVECAPASAQAFTPVGPRQISALHAKCNELARKRQRPASTFKDDVKAAAVAELGLPEGFSFTEISYGHASWCLDWLDDLIFDTSAAV